MGVDLLPQAVRDKYEVAERHHACAILSTDFPSEWKDLNDALAQLTLPKSQILTAGGAKSPISKGINGFFFSRGWKERQFKILTGSAYFDRSRAWNGTCSVAGRKRHGDIPLQPHATRGPQIVAGPHAAHDAPTHQPRRQGCSR